MWGSGPPTVVVGDVIAAATGNLYRDLFLETAPAKATAAGQLFRATGAGAIEAFAVGSAGQLLGVSGGLPAWIAAPSMQTVVIPTGNSIGVGTGAAWTDILTLSLAPGTYFISAYLWQLCGSGFGPMWARVRLDGTSVDIGGSFLQPGTGSGGYAEHVISGPVTVTGSTTTLRAQAHAAGTSGIIVHSGSPAAIAGGATISTEPVTRMTALKIA